MHTSYCDGSNTAEEMIRAAAAQGLEEIGFTGHSHTPFDESYCMSPEVTQQYRQELLALRDKYANQIRIRIGLEMDRYSDADPSDFDYIIGSVHYIRVPDPGAFVPEGCLPFTEDGKAWIYIPMDETAEITKAAADAYFGGDLIALAERYFETIGTVAEATGCNIIGHFDLLTKFNEPWIRQGETAAGAVGGYGTPLIDTGDPRYIRAWQKAVDQLLQADIPFEINTGAISKGYRSEPYPARPIRDYLRSRGGRFILSSDSHRSDTLCYRFDPYEAEASPAAYDGMFGKNCT
ncbi:MAG: histidinol-phosphatase [Firmicutes bacterium]|nr:histidinol-phosphatase [Bacillota bacterium]